MGQGRRQFTDEFKREAERIPFMSFCSAPIPVILASD